MSRRFLLRFGIVSAFILALVAWQSCRSRRHGSPSGSAAKSGQVGAGGAAATPKHSGPVAPASLAGRVTRASDGAGIPGAVVSLAPAELMAMFMKGNTPTRVAVTDATGAWKVNGVAPGNYVVAATAAGYLPASKAKFLVGAGEQKTGVDITLAAGGTIVSGTVTDVGGGPIADARITAVLDRDLPEFWGHADLITTTGADGKYALTLADGTYSIHAEHDEYTDDSERAELKGQPLTVDFTLIPGAVIRGQVIARDSGKPVPGAFVRTEGGHGGSDSTGNTIADADGNFTLKSLGAGSLDLYAMGRGYATQTPTNVAVGIGEQVEGVKILVDRAYSISGRAVRKGKSDQGLPGVTLGAFSIAAKSFGLALEPSATDGSFEIVGLRPASYIVGAIGEGSVPEVGKNVEIVDKDVEGVIVELSAGATIAGRVEPPMEGAAITIEPTIPIGIANMFEAIKSILVRGETDAQGAFTLKNVPAGAFKLAAMARDGHAGSMPLVVSDIDQSGVVIKLEARGSISGRVVDTNGKAVPGIEVKARRTDEKQDSNFEINFGGSKNTETKSNGDGSFKIVGLEAGSYKVTASTGDWYDQISSMRSEKGDKDKVQLPKSAAMVELAATAEKTGVTLTVDARDGVIRGTVIGPDKKPAADAWVTAHMKHDVPTGMPDEFADRFDGYGQGTTPVLTTADGQFTISRLRKGTYKIVVEGPRGATHAEKTGVKSGDSVTIQLASLGTLSGKVTASGKPVTKFDIRCDGKDDDKERSFDAADGAYTLERLAPGPYSCKVTSDAGTATQKLEIPAGPLTADYTLTPWATISGVVVSILDKRPIAGVLALAGNTFGEENMGNLLGGKAPVTDPTGHFLIERVAEGKGKLAIMPKDGGFQPLGTRDYTATAGQRVDVGTIEVVPPRTGDAGTFGFATNIDGANLVVSSVKEDGPAAAAGVAVGDHITSINGRAVADMTPPIAQMLISSGTVGVGQTIQLALDRGGSPVTATVTSVKW